MRSQRREFGNNSPLKRGIISQRDPKAMKVKIKFPDEDNVESNWIDVPVKSSGATKLFMMPGEADEVWVGLDAKGEYGCIIGSRYNSKETPSHSSNDDIALTFAGGMIHVDTASGAVVIETAGTVTIKAGDIKLESGTLTHNGVNIGNDHKHKDVVVGGDLTGEPV